MATVTFFFADQAGSTVQLAFSPDGRLLAVGTLPRPPTRSEVQLWDVAGRRQHSSALEADVPGGRAHAIAASSPDDRTLVAGGRLGRLRFWDPATGAKLAEPATTRADIIVDLAFSPDGRLLASGSVDGTVIIWNAQDVPSRRQAGRSLAGHTADAIGVAFVDGGHTLVTSSIDGSLIFWDLRPSAWEAKACALAGRNLTWDEWRQFIGGDYRRTCRQWPEEG